MNTYAIEIWSSAADSVAESKKRNMYNENRFLLDDILQSLH